MILLNLDTSVYYTQPLIDTHPQTRYPCAASPPAPFSCALCGGCGSVLGGQSVQYAAAVFGQYGLLKEGLELFLGQRYGVGQQFAAERADESRYLNTERNARKTL